MGRRPRSRKVILSYVFDWAIVLFATAVGAVLANMTPNKRPFSLSNPEISYPFQHQEKVSLAMLGLYAMGLPAVIIFTVCMVLVPGPTIPKQIPKHAIWSRKLWEWHVGWLGLALSLSSSFLITSGMKNLFGKPRPDLLSRCDPDIVNLERYRLGGFMGTDVVSAAICRQTNMELLDDGFRSYPSGHSSFAAGGLIYLSLFIASKLAITIPYLPPSAFTGSEKLRLAAFPSHSARYYGKQETCSGDINKQGITGQASEHNPVIIGARNEAAAPPIYLLIFAVVPFFTSVYIASTRFSDYRHHGFDIIFGYVIGFICSVFSFRWYHLPIMQGAGWAWGPRSSERSFWAGVGVGNYVGVLNKPKDDDASKRALDHDQNDIEAGTRSENPNVSPVRLQV